MNDLMKCLYEFMIERRLGNIWNDPEYEETAHSSEMQMKRLEKDLNEEQQRELRILLEEISALNSIESEHRFQAALGLARELSALAG